MSWVVQATAELNRVIAQPLREWSPIAIERATEIMQSQLGRPGGTMRLLPVQAQALLEITTYRGAFLPIQVGGGKTLISLLAPTCTQAVRPLLVTKAGLVEKTHQTMRDMWPHFRVAPHLRIMSYEALGRQSGEFALVEMKPDLIVLDECQAVKNRSASCTRRLERYLNAHPTPLVAMSGTITNRSIKEYAHLVRHTHGARAWLPLTDLEAEEWGQALDSEVAERTAWGALWMLGPGVGVNVDSLETARQAYQLRMARTPGVVITADKETGSSLEIREVGFGKLPESCTAAIQWLYEKRELPDGWELSSPTEVWRHAQELALGFFSTWDPRPPEEWRAKRKAWAGLCFKILENSPTLDSPAVVATHVKAGRFGEGVAAVYQAWKEIEPTFQVHQSSKWLSGHAVDWAADWMSRNPTSLVWVWHRPFGAALTRATGVPYFGNEGKAPGGLHLDNYKGRQAICSIAANSTGRNLQDRWSTNLIISPPSTGLLWEQLLGRTHRQGQRADTVTADVLISCRESVEAFERAISDSLYNLQTTGQPWKLTYADIIRNPKLNDFPLKP